MTSITANRLACGAVILWALGSASAVRAQISLGTWVQQSGALTMTVEACCSGGLRFIYRVAGSSDTLMTIESPMDGRDVPVFAAGKPTGETMGIKRVDDHHTLTVVKMNGKPFGTSKATLSADGKTLTIENEFTSTAGGPPAGKQTETWVRK